MFKPGAPVRVICPGYETFDATVVKAYPEYDLYLVNDKDGLEFHFHREDLKLQHVDFLHTPGSLYDCPACEAYCFCFPMEAQCLHCEIEANADLRALIQDCHG